MTKFTSEQLEFLKDRIEFTQEGEGFNLYCDVRGNVYGSIFGDVKGNVYGSVCDVTGDVEGSVEGNVKGYVLGDVKGHVYGDVKGDVKGNVLGGVKGKVRGNTGNASDAPLTKPSRWEVHDCAGFYGSFRDYNRAVEIAKYLAEIDEFVEVVSVTYKPVNFKEK